MTAPTATDLQWLHDALNEAYGEPGTLESQWGVTEGWPAESRFEIMAGAVLTQNTAWRNVERALANLRDRGWLSSQAVIEAPEAELAEAVRPAGYYRTKARYLKNASEWLESAGGFGSLARRPLRALRKELLGVKGVGPETADAILLFALGQPVFVVDAYTRRLWKRLGWQGSDRPYDELRQAFEIGLPASPALFAGFHALIVTHAKAVCRTRPLCQECALRQDCLFGRTGAVAGG